MRTDVSYERQRGGVAGYREPCRPRAYMGRNQGNILVYEAADGDAGVPTEQPLRGQGLRVCLLIRALILAGAPSSRPANTSEYIGVSRRRAGRVSWTARA